jgi:polyketide cyclase/dehydrase/lipid transport protein
MRISRTVEVKQSPRSVWATLENFDQWSKWATPLGAPRRISAGRWQPGWRGKLGGTTFEITELIDVGVGKQMIWTGGSFGTDSVWTVLVEPVRGKTEATFIVEQNGWIPSLFGRWTGKGLDRKLKDALEGFRKHAESSPAIPRVTQE